MDEYLTTDEVAQRLDVKVETVRRWVRQGKLPGFPLGRAGYRIRQEDFNSFVQGEESEPSLSHSITPSNNSHGMSESHIEAAATLILERMTDGVLLFGLDGLCQYANRRVEQLLGLAPDDLIGMTIDQVLPRNIANGEKSVGKNDYFSAATGRWYQVRIFSTPQGRCVSFLDISERKQLEEQLHQREQQFATLVEHLPDVIFRLDKQLRHIYISPIIEHITGVVPANWIGKTGREMGLPSDICDPFEVLCQKAMTSGEEQRMQFFHLGRWHRSRILPEFASDGSVLSLMGITEDITESKYRQLNATFLSELTEEFNRLSSPEEILQTVGKRMRQYFNVSSLTCALVNEAANEFTIVYDSNKQNPMGVSKPQRLSEYANDEMLCKMKAGHIIVVNDVAADPRTAAYSESFTLYPVRAFILASHVSNGQVDFVIGMQRSEPYHWRKDEIALLQELITRIYPQLERVRAEQALRQSEEQVHTERQRLHDLFMQAPAAITVVHGPEHVYELINPLALQRMGLHRSPLGVPVREVLPELEGQGFFELLDNVYQTGKPFIGKEVPSKFDSKGDGTLEQSYVNFAYQPSYNASGEIDGVLAFVNDVTDMVLARKRAEESEERLRSLANSMPQLVWSANADGNIDFFNERMNEYAEIPGNEDGIYEWQAIVHPDDIEAVQHNWGHVTKTGNAFEHELRLRMKNGTYRWHLTRGVPVHDANGSIFRWYGTKTDIEQLKQLERQKNDFIGVVSHELKTPVTSAKAFAEVLENRFHRAGDEKSANLLAKMNAQMDKLTLLIGDLLDVTRIEAEKLQFHEDFFAFDELVESIIEEVQRTTSHSIRREGTTGTTVYADRERIGQVITNLLTNAVKYSPNATTVIVKISRSQNDVMLCVQDFGIGIARSRLPVVDPKPWTQRKPK